MLALKMKKEVTGQGIQATSRQGKDKGPDFPLKYPQATGNSVLLLP